MLRLRESSCRKYTVETGAKHQAPVGASEGPVPRCRSFQLTLMCCVLKLDCTGY